MVRLDLLSGKLAGTRWVTRHFPVQIGRSASCDLRLEESGVWDQHAQMRFDHGEGFLLEAHTNALTTVNGQSVQTIRLRNGDSIMLGSVHIRFWLDAVRQRELWLLEWFAWLLIIGVTAAQIFLVYQLPR